MGKTATEPTATNLVEKQETDLIPNENDTTSDGLEVLDEGYEVATLKDQVQDILREYKETTSENAPFYFVVVKSLEEAISKM